MSDSCGGGAHNGPWSCPPSYPERERRHHCPRCGQDVLGEPHCCAPELARDRAREVMAGILDVIGNALARERAEGVAEGLRRGEVRT